MNDDPYVRDCYTKYPRYCPNPGIDIEFIYTVINYMVGFHITWFKYETNSDLEMALDENEIDMIGTIYALQDIYSSRWMYAPTTNYDGPAFIVKSKYRNKIDEELLLLKMFTWELWLGLFSLSLITIWMQYLPKSIRKKINVRRPSNSLFSININFNAKLVMTFWFIILGILLNLFGNLIVVNLTLSNIDEDVLFTNISQLGELVAKQKCRLAILEQYKDEQVFYPFILNPSHNKTWAENFRIAYRLNQPIYVKDRSELVQLINESHSCVVGVDWMTLESFYKKRHCEVKMIVIYHEFIPWMFVYYHRVEHYSELFKAVTMSNSIASYYNYLMQEYYYSVDAAICEALHHAETQPIPMNKVKDGFIVLSVGVLLAFVVFVLMHVKKCI